MNAVIEVDRKEQIMRDAVEIIATQGYAKFTMRALARVSNLKLGALQYHYPTWEALLRALADYVSEQYTLSLQALEGQFNDLSIHTLAEWYFEGAGGNALRAEFLWPQLWAMGHVEPAMREALHAIYSEVLDMFTAAFARAGSTHPHLDAIKLVSLGEGSLLFVSAEGPWQEDVAAIYETVKAELRDRFPGA